MTTRRVRAALIVALAALAVTVVVLAAILTDRLTGDSTPTPTPAAPSAYTNPPTTAPATTAAAPTTPARTTTPAADEPEGARTTIRPPRRGAGPATTRPRTTAPRTTPVTDPDETEPVTGVGYDNCDELRDDYKAGVPRGHPAYESRFDRDNDGWACELDAGALLPELLPAPTTPAV